MKIETIWNCSPTFPDDYPDSWKKIIEFLEQEDFAKVCIIGDKDYGMYMGFRFIRRDGLKSEVLERTQQEFNNWVDGSDAEFEMFKNELRRIAKTKKIIE